jgi:anti-sigma B factor antagonist
MTETHLSCYTRQEGRRTVLAIEGTLDVATCEQATRAIQRHIEEQQGDVFLDASRLNFIDSKGVGVLLGAVKAVRDRSARIYLQNPTVPVQKILDLCGLTPLFPAPAPPEPAEERQPAAAARPASRPLRRAA